MKFRSLLLIITMAGLLAGCTTSKKIYQVVKNPNIRVGDRLDQPSTYSLSIYATDRANINLYSDDDNVDTDSTSEASAQTSEIEYEYAYDSDSNLVNLKAKKLTNQESIQNLNTSDSDEKIVIKEEQGKADTRATPVVLKIFQLKDKSLFLSTSYDDFRDSNFNESLGKTYVSNKDLIIAPNQFRFIDTEPLNEETHYVGVVALYNGYEDRTWKGIVKVKPKGGEYYPLLIRVLESKVEIHKDN